MINIDMTSVYNKQKNKIFLTLLMIFLQISHSFFRSGEVTQQQVAWLVIWKIKMTVFPFGITKHDRSKGRI